GPAFGNHLMGLTGELVLARSLRDVAAALDAVAGHAQGPFADPAIASKAVLPALRIGVVAAAPGLADIAHDQAGAIASAAAILDNAGHRVVEIAAEEIAGIASDSLHCAATILSVSLAGWLDALDIPDHEVSPLAAAVAADGRSTSATKLFDSARQM